VIALLAAIGLVGAAQAGPDPAMVDALTRWADCNGRLAVERAVSAEPAERVADAIAEACIAEERRVETLTIAESNAEAAAGEIRAMRAHLRGLNLARIAQARGGPAPPDDAGAVFGRCVLTHALASAGGPEQAELLADRAIAACHGEEDAALTNALPRADSATIETVRRSLRDRVREAVLRRIAEARASR